MADDFDLSVKIARILIENGISSEPSLDYNIHSWRCERSTTQCTCFDELVKELSNVLDKPDDNSEATFPIADGEWHDFGFPLGSQRYQVVDGSIYFETK